MGFVVGGHAFDVLFGGATFGELEEQLEAHGDASNFDARGSGSEFGDDQIAPAAVLGPHRRM